MTQASYNQFCPVAMASEILCTRWTVILLRELTVGTCRFNDLRRGVPRMSPALLSKRLKDLEASGIVSRSKAAKGPDVYELTAAGKALKPIVLAIGDWGLQWVTAEAALENLDVGLLMWDMRRNIDPKPLPTRRCVIQVIYSDLPASKKNWWLIVEPGKPTDLCSVDPGFDVDVYLSTNLRTMTEIWMGYTSIARAKKDGRFVVTGERQIVASMQGWFARSPFAANEKRAA